jgi:hypothetical protein
MEDVSQSVLDHCTHLPWWWRVVTNRSADSSEPLCFFLFTEVSHFSETSADYSATNDVVTEKINMKY